MERAGRFLISAGEGTILLFFLFLGAFMSWQFQKAYPRSSRAAAWGLMSAGVISVQFSFAVGVYLAIIGAVLLAICDCGKSSP